MGDSTFFHSGQIAITNSLKANQDITFIILQNGTTAMTGHQDHAGVEEDMFGNVHPAISIESIVRAMSSRMKVVQHVAGQAREVLQPSRKHDPRRRREGHHRRQGMRHHVPTRPPAQEREIIRKTGYLPRKTHMNVTPEVCENCLECTKQTACPGLTNVHTDYGPKIDTDLTWCVDDGACERVRVSNEAGTSAKPCPSFEEVTVVHRRRRRYLLPNMSLDKLPDPRIGHDMSAPGASWSCHMSGVGGMGIGLVSAILVRAGHAEGYRVVFQEKKGMAIRNGGTFSQITFVRDDAPLPSSPSAPPPPADAPTSPQQAISGSIPYGGADLLLGIDILEAARAIDPRQSFRVASRGRTCAVLNMHKQSTVSCLLGTADFDPDVLREEIYEHCQQDTCYANDLSDICEQRLRSKQFVNIMMLGVAYQLGRIPVSAHSIAWAIKDTIKREHRRNLKAFNIGRKLALEPRALPPKPQPHSWQQLLTNKSRILRKTRLLGKRWSRRYEYVVQRAMREMRDLPDRLKYDLALRIYDVLQYQDHRLARRYVELIRDIYRRDSSEREFAATGAAIWNLAKVMLIKDEPYVAYLLTRYEKQQRDLVKYGVDVANGDRLVYRHYTSPEFNIGRFRIRVKLRTRNWLLRIVRHCKWLRRLPRWHEREAAFREWYIGLLGRIDLSSDAGYEKSLTALRCVENVSGYREVRYPKMDAARAAAEKALGAGNLTAEAQRMPEKTMAEDTSADK